MILRGIRSAARQYVARDSGVAAFELVIWLAALIPALFSIVDIGAYVFQRMQVENAAQMAVQATWESCPSPPAGATCSSLTAVTTGVNAALASTSLGAGVTQDADAYQEGYFCPDPNAEPDAQTLTQLTGGSTTCPNGSPAGYYVALTASYDFTPVITGVSVASLFPTPITYQAWSRMK